MLATGLTLVFGSAAKAQILPEMQPFEFPAFSKPRRIALRHDSGNSFA